MPPPLPGAVIAPTLALVTLFVWPCTTAHAQFNPALDASPMLESDSFAIARPRQIFFPPNPPPVGVDVLPARSGRSSGPPTNASLRPFVTEPFYAPLSAFRDRELLPGLGSEPLTESQRNMLQSFVELRETQRDALRARLGALAQATPEHRRQELEKFAVVQAPSLAEIEELAEKLRASLAQRLNWNEYREWRLGRGRYDGKRDVTIALEFEVVRAAAYYQAGLSPAQRRLARELAMEMGEALRAREHATPVDRIFLAFSPETSRIRLPEAPGPHLAGLIDRYRQEKTTLKAEIADEIYESDRKILGLSRNIAMRRLATEHESRLASLEGLADEIRRALQQHPGYPRVTSRTTIPISLFKRVLAFAEARRGFDAERRRAIARATAATRRASPTPPTPAERAEREAERRDVARRTGSQFDVEHTERLRALEEEAAQLQDELERVLPPTEAATLPGTPEEFIFTLLVRLKQRSAYTDYDVAVLEPALSPEQRRLLFGAAVEALNLPLPGGELQPTRAPGTLLPPQ